MDIEVTRLAVEHEARVYAMLAEEGLGQLAEDLLVKRHPPCDIYVALAGPGPVGILAGSHDYRGDTGELAYPPPQSRVHAMLTVPAARRRGVGSALMYRFASEGIAAGRSYLLLWVDPRDPMEELAFFASCGFEPTHGGAFLGATLGTVLARTASRSASAMR